MVTLSEAIEAEASLAATGACKLERIRRSLDDQSAERLEELINDSTGYPAPGLARILLRVEQPISPSTIVAHRGQNCACYLSGRAA